MLSNIFPQNFYLILNKTPIEKITEIRIRLLKKIVVAIGSKYFYLSEDGLTGNELKAIVAEKTLIDDIVKKACENSVYAYDNQIKNGFLTVCGGIRIGLTGEVVFDKNSVKTLKNINSLVIRVPHEIKGCSLPIMPYLVEKKFLNALIVSPPGGGKTTMIRDIIYQLSQKSYCFNVLLVDERFEIANCFNGQATLDVGNFCDILSGTNKNYAFENGVKNLKPDIIATDEISNAKDYDSILYASSCGVSILASIHANGIDDLKQKTDFKILLENKVFSRFIILSQNDYPGKIEAIYDENLRLINL